MFAYGQTGAGKSYSFVGYGVNKGILPIVSNEIFQKVRAEQSDRHVFQIGCSYMELYGRELRDLLNPRPKESRQGEKLRIRNGKQGTYVQGVKKMAVASYDEIEKVQDVGNSNRTVGATLMNATSSRAHTIVTISLTQLMKEDGRTKELSSDIVLVDLAGSERAESTGAKGARLQEGIEINVSLSALGNVISALAEKANNPHKKVFVPYRSHVLTELLQSALGGNSKTVMVAAVSPASINFDETLGTLRYADRAKQIKVVVEVQESPTDKLIRELKAENGKLKLMLKQMQGGGDQGGGGAAIGSMLEITAPADGGLPLSEAPPPHTLRQADLVQQISAAVHKVGGVSEADRRKAIAEVGRQMEARNEGLRRNQLELEDMQVLITSALSSVEGVSDVSKADAIVEATSELERLRGLQALKAKAGVGAKGVGVGGGVVDHEDAIQLVFEGLDMWDTTQTEVPRPELQAAIDLSEKLLAADQPLWEDGVLTADELTDVMARVVVALKSASVDSQQRAIGACLYNFEGERQAALGNVTCKEVMMKAIRSAHSLLGTDGANSSEDFQQIHKASTYAEMAFDQMQMHADLQVVDGEVAGNMLDKVMRMLGGNSEAIDAAKAAAKAAIDASLHGSLHSSAAIAAQLGRNRSMLSGLGVDVTGLGDLEDEMGVTAMSRRELILMCSAQRAEVLTVREQLAQCDGNDGNPHPSPLDPSPSPRRKTAPAAPAAPAAPGLARRSSSELEEMAAFASQLQEQLTAAEKKAADVKVVVVKQLAELAKERDAARANAMASDLVTRVAVKSSRDPKSKACALQ